MSDQVQTPPSRWYVPLSLYREDAATAAKAVPTGLGLGTFGALMMRPVHWPAYCIVCAAANPTETDEVSWFQSTGGPTSYTFTRKDVPICKRCNEVKKAGERASSLPEVAVVGPLVISGLGILLGIAVLFISPFWRDGVSILAVSLGIGLVGGGACLLVYRYRMAQFFRAYPEARELPWNAPVVMNEMGFSFAVKEYAIKFAEANASSVQEPPPAF